MFKKIALFCALVGLVAFVAGSAYAEVQNIKISGDIAAYAIYRDNYDLEDEGWTNPLDVNLAPINRNRGTEDEDSLFMSVVRLRVDADLTDNVSATVRIGNAREWDAFAAGADAEEIMLDLAYVTLKEMLYSPLTLMIGRQELVYGNGLIIGYGMYYDINNTLIYNEFSPFHGHDAIRAVLDYDPWTFDLVIAKITENDDGADNAAPLAARDSDTDLYVVNVGYQFPSYDAEAEGYLFFLRQENWARTIQAVNWRGNQDHPSRQYDENHLYTLGLRGSMVPLDNLTLGAEIAGQLGHIEDQPQTPGTDMGHEDSYKRDREALLANVAAEYDFVDVRFMPTLGAEYLFVSGEEASQGGDFDEWDPMFRGKVLGSIRDCLETLYTTNDNLDTGGNTNQHTVKVKGGLDLGELVDGLNLTMAYLHYWFDEEPLPQSDDDIGDEINLTLIYDYTEDVQFALDSAWFIPGDYYDRIGTGNAEKGLRGNTAATKFGAGNQSSGRVAHDTAVSVVGSCRVTF